MSGATARYVKMEEHLQDALKAKRVGLQSKPKAFDRVRMLILWNKKSEY